MHQVTTNADDYRATLRLYARARKKPEAEVVQRFAQQANFRMAGPESRGGVRRAKLSMFPLNATADPEKGGRTYKGRFFYAEQASLGVKKGSDGEIVMRPAAKRSWSKRRSAKGAMAAGFLTSSKKLGLRRGGRGKVVSGGSASRSSGRLRKQARNPSATSVNAVEGSFEVGAQAMDKAILFVIRDAREFALNLIQETNARAMSGAI